MDMKLDILNILDKSCEVADINKIARMLGKTEAEVADVIKGLEKDNIIVGYKTMINWEGTDKEIVDALIELKVTPQRGEGFDKVAEKIYKYPQVKSLYLMSGAYDLAVMIQGETMKDVALFVAQKLAPMDNIQSTATHFVLKKYKDHGTVLDVPNDDERMLVTP